MLVARLCASNPPPQKRGCAQLYRSLKVASMIQRTTPRGCVRRGCAAVPQRATHARRHKGEAAAALPRLADLVPWLGGAASGRLAANPLQAERDELLQLLIDGADGADGPGGGARGGRERRVSALVDALLESRLPFDEAKLGGGPWVVLYTKGALQLWRATWQAGRLLSGDAGNEASQEFDPAGRRALNRAEYAGGAVYVTAGGSYTPLGDGTTAPQPVRADISSGALHLYGLDVPLPIRGSGRFEVMYLDDDLRIFRSGSSVSVQVRKAALAARRARQRRGSGRGAS